MVSLLRHTCHWHPFARSTPRLLCCVALHAAPAASSTSPSHPY